MRHVVEDTTAFTAEIEVVGDAVFFHCQVREWNKAVYLYMRELFGGICDALAYLRYDKVFAAIPPDNKKLLKFCKMFGMEPVEEISGSLLLVRKI